LRFPAKGSAEKVSLSDLSQNTGMKEIFNHVLKNDPATTNTVKNSGNSRSEKALRVNKHA
jgi:hypothetical protein